MGRVINKMDGGAACASRALVKYLESIALWHAAEKKKSGRREKLRSIEQEKRDQMRACDKKSVLVREEGRK